MVPPRLCAFAHSLFSPRRADPLFASLCLSLPYPLFLDDSQEKEGVAGTGCRARTYKSGEVDWTEIEWLEARLEGSWLFIQTTIVIALHVAAGRTKIEGAYLWETDE